VNRLKGDPVRSHCLAVALLVLLLLGGVVHMAIYYPVLPAKMASHFDGAGRPNDWMAKGVFMAVYAGLIFGLAGIMILTALLIPKMPRFLVNLPHKEYRLAPQRRRQTLGCLPRSMFWFTDATLAFLIAVMQLTFHANLQPQPALGATFWVVTGAYTAVIVVWAICYYRRFRVPAPIDDGVRPVAKGAGRL